MSQFDPTEPDVTTQLDREMRQAAYCIGYRDGFRDSKRMPQTSIIVAALLIGFIVFITMRGELSKYLHIIGLA